MWGMGRGLLWMVPLIIATWNVFVLYLNGGVVHIAKGVKFELGIFFL